MIEPSAPTLDVLARLHQTTAYVKALTESVLVGSMSNRHNALALPPNALATLHARVEAAVAALDADHRRGEV